MKRRNLTLDRRAKKRICECGGEIKFLYIDGNLTPHTRCLKCGKEHAGIAGTKHAWVCDQCGGIEPCSNDVSYCCDCGAEVVE